MSDILSSTFQRHKSEQGITARIGYDMNNTIGGSKAVYDQVARLIASNAGLGQSGNTIAINQRGPRMLDIGAVVPKGTMNSVQPKLDTQFDTELRKILGAYNEEMLSSDADAVMDYARSMGIMGLKTNAAGQVTPYHADRFTRVSMNPLTKGMEREMARQAKARGAMYKVSGEHGDRMFSQYYRSRNYGAVDRLQDKEAALIADLEAGKRPRGDLEGMFMDTATKNIIKSREHTNLDRKRSGDLSAFSPDLVAELEAKMLLQQDEKLIKQGLKKKLQKEGRLESEDSDKKGALSKTASALNGILSSVKAATDALKTIAQIGLQMLSYLSALVAENMQNQKDSATLGLPTDTVYRARLFGKRYSGFSGGNTNVLLDAFKEMNSTFGNVMLLDRNQGLLNHLAPANSEMAGYITRAAVNKESPDVMTSKVLGFLLRNIREHRGVLGENVGSALAAERSALQVLNSQAGMTGMGEALNTILMIARSNAADNGTSLETEIGRFGSDPLSILMQTRSLSKGYLIPGNMFMSPMYSQDSAGFMGAKAKGDLEVAKNEINDFLLSNMDKVIMLLAKIAEGIAWIVAHAPFVGPTVNKAGRSMLKQIQGMQGQIAESWYTDIAKTSKAANDVSWDMLTENTPGVSIKIRNMLADTIKKVINGQGDATDMARLRAWIPNEQALYSTVLAFKNASLAKKARQGAFLARQRGEFPDGAGRAEMFFSQNYLEATQGIADYFPGVTSEMANESTRRNLKRVQGKRYIGAASSASEVNKKMLAKILEGLSPEDAAILKRAIVLFTTGDEVGAIDTLKEARGFFDHGKYYNLLYRFKAYKNKAFGVELEKDNQEIQKYQQELDNILNQQGSLFKFNMRGVPRQPLSSPNTMVAFGNAQVDINLYSNGRQVGSTSVELSNDQMRRKAAGQMSVGIDMTNIV